MDEHPFRRWLTVALCFTGIGLLFTPDSITMPFRTNIRDFLAPGQQALLAGKARWEALFPTKNHTEIDDLQRELASEQTRSRIWQQKAVELKAELDRPSPALTIPLEASSSGRLFVPALIDAGVLGDELASRWRSGKLLDAGERAGVREAAWVLQSQQPLLDLGQDQNVTAADLVLAGRSIIGKVERVRRWTSTFMFVTDPQFRTRVQVVRDTSRGPIQGPKGVLRGQGKPHCRLEGIDADETLRVGDDVYTADRDGIAPTPLYLGKITRVTLRTEGKDWEIDVEPAPLPQPLTRVQILRITFNPHRPLAN